MWLCLNNGFLSVVDFGNDDFLLVRARDSTSIPNIFGNVYKDKQKVTPDKDYMYRCYIKRDLVAKVISENIMNISYNNFKDSVKNKKLKDAYNDVWTTMFCYQYDNHFKKYDGYTTKIKQLNPLVTDYNYTNYKK